tara:strand:+ start:538 stop:870 length:333 start_codon:yes stop_codon:yes gene_type:complete
MDCFIKKISKNKKNINHSAYLGDLLVTAYSLFSRNRCFVNMIGRGYTEKGAQMESMVTEGYYASKSAFKVSQKIKTKRLLSIQYIISYILRKAPKRYSKNLQKNWVRVLL